MKKGQTMSDEQREKISRAHKGKIKPWSGKYMTTEHKLQISKRMKGNTLSLGRIHSNETKEKIRLSNLGKEHNISEEGRNRMRIKNHVPWNKGTRGVMHAWNKGKTGVMGEHWNKGNDSRKDAVCRTCAVTFKTHRRKYCSNACYYKSRIGEGNPKWIHDRNKVKLDTDRGGPLHKQWSIAVKARDGWKCKINDNECSGRLESHHILSWNKHTMLRYEISNGITLCHFHHPRKKEDEEKMIPSFLRLLNS